MGEIVHVIVQMRGNSCLKHGILSVGIRLPDKSIQRISFKKARFRIQSQDWDKNYKNIWDATRESKDSLTKIEMESYEPEIACKKIREIFNKVLTEYQQISVAAHPEDIGVLSSYIDYFLEEGGFFRKFKFLPCFYENKNGVLVNNIFEEKKE